MKKIFLICILFIFLFSFNKSDDNNFDYEEFLDNLTELIKDYQDQKLINFINDKWNELSYIQKNIIYQNIDLIKNNCISKLVYDSKKCKIIFDILGIL